MRKLYKSIRNPIRCKALNEDIYFNSDGFFHLRYDGTRVKRPAKEERNKLNLLPLVIPVLKTATEISHEVRKVGKKEIQYWALVAMVGKTNTKVKIILRKVGNGRIAFWSVMRMR